MITDTLPTDPKDQKVNSLLSSEDKRIPVFIRIRDFLVHAIVQIRVFRNIYPGIMHALIFWGMLIQIIGTVINLMQMELFIPFVELTFPRDRAYFIYEFVMDLGGTAILLGVLMALFRRIVIRPKKLDSQWDDYFVLFLLLLIPLAGFTLEGSRLLASTPAWAQWSPIGSFTARLLSTLGMSPETAMALHPYLYWLHIALGLTFVATIAFTKSFHIITAPFNILTKPMRPLGQLNPVPVTSDGEQIYIKTLYDLSGKQLLESDTCTRCGRCQDVCPSFAAGTPLNPKDVILNLRNALFQDRLSPRSGNGKTPLLIEELIKDEALWACTTCGACIRECPVFISHVDTIVDLRRFLVLEGRVDTELQDALTNLGRYGNSFGKSDRMRTRWSSEIYPEIKDALKEPVEYLWYVGDYASYSPSLTKITQITAQVFQNIGLDFGILYRGENHSGNDARRAGEEGLFEMLVEKNMRALQRSDYQTIVTTDPHTYNTLKNEYPLPENLTILHYSELLSQLIKDGRLRFSRRLDYKVTYHDPCYLGRYNGVYDAPRSVIKATGCDLVEMPRNRDKAFCCGAGGGRIWMEEGQIEERPSESRIREAVELEGISCFVVACPKDVTMYQDAVKTTGHENELLIKDLIELVSEAL